MAFNKSSIAIRHNHRFVDFLYPASHLLPFPPSSLLTLIPTAPGNDRRRSFASRAVVAPQPLNPKKPHSFTGVMIDTEGAIAAIQLLSDRSIN